MKTLSVSPTCSPRSPDSSFDARPVLGAGIHALTWEDAISRVTAWASIRSSRYICICNVHSVVTASLDEDFMKVVNEADLCAPDGAPVAWALRRLGVPKQERISGPDLMWIYLKEAERLGHAVYFYGSTGTTLLKLKQALLRNFPSLKIAGMHAPPFRTLSAEEDAAETAMINDSGAQVVFVGLGCPKQEKWMAAHRGKINAVMIGVGAAFDYHSGVVRRAPLWWQQHGLEWLYRLMSEPRRLFKRYLVTNTLFVLGFSKQLLTAKLMPRSRSVKADMAEG